MGPLAGGTSVAAPVVTGLSPTGGPIGGGTSVTITGTGLTGATLVKFGTTVPAYFVVEMIDGITIITTESPPGTGVVDVTVTTPSGTSGTSLADRFTYVGARWLRCSTRTRGPPQVVRT